MHRAPAFTCDAGKALHSEIGAKLLTHLEANSRNFSECTLILQRNLSDFDSAIEAAGQPPALEYGLPHAMGGRDGSDGAIRRSLRAQAAGRSYR
jgi:hypothetical protein